MRVVAIQYQNVRPLRSASNVVTKMSQPLEKQCTVHPPWVSHSTDRSCWGTTQGRKGREVVCGQVWWPILGICPLHLTLPSAHSQQWTHTWSSGQPYCGARGAVGRSVPCSRVSPQSWYWRWREHLLFTPPTNNPCRTWESNRQPLGYKSNSLTSRPRLPIRRSGGLLVTQQALIHSFSWKNEQWWYKLPSGVHGTGSSDSKASFCTCDSCHLPLPLWTNNFVWLLYILDTHLIHIPQTGGVNVFAKPMELILIIRKNRSTFGLLNPTILEMLVACGVLTDRVPCLLRKL